jgi:hypothetical protein
VSAKRGESPQRAFGIGAEFSGIEVVSEAPDYEQRRALVLELGDGQTLKLPLAADETRDTDYLAKIMPRQWNVRVEAVE